MFMPIGTGRSTCCAGRPSSEVSNKSVWSVHLFAKMMGSNNNTVDTAVPEISNNRKKEEQHFVVHPSFAVPIFDKENDYHRTTGSHHHYGMAPVTPGTKPRKKAAMTTGKARTKKSTLLHQKPIRVPLSSKSTNRIMNPFGACDVSLHGDYASVRAVGGSASKTARGRDNDDNVSVVSAHLYHVGGPISSGAARVRTPHGKAAAR